MNLHWATTTPSIEILCKRPALLDLIYVPSTGVFSYFVDCLSQPMPHRLKLSRCHARDLLKLCR